MSDNIFNTISELRKKVDELEAELRLERYTAEEILDLLDRGLTRQALEVKVFLDEVGNQTPHLIAEEMDINILQVYGALDLLDDLDMLPPEMELTELVKNGSFLTRVSVEDFELPDMAFPTFPELDKAMQDLMSAMGVPAEMLEPKKPEGKIVQFPARVVEAAKDDLTDEQMLQLLIMARMRSDGDWPTVHSSSRARWSERFQAVADALGLPSPRQFGNRFGSVTAAKEAAANLLDETTLNDTETEEFESDSAVMLVDDGEGVDQWGEREMNYSYEDDR